MNLRKLKSVFVASTRFNFIKNDFALLEIIFFIKVFKEENNFNSKNDLKLKKIFFVKGRR